MKFHNAKLVMYGNILLLMMTTRAENHPAAVTVESTTKGRGNRTLRAPCW